MRRMLCAGAALAAATLALPAGAGELKAWVIDATAEKPYFEQLPQAFNARYAAEGTTLEVQPVPNFNDAIQAASISGGLPDIILLDGPNMAAAAWAGTIQPIGGLIDPALLEDMLPGVLDQGTYGPTGELFFLSPYDSTVLLWGNRRHLDAAGIRIPAGVEDAWTRAELRDALEKLAKVEGVSWPIDLKLNYGAGEWMTYGFAPFLQSNGGDLIDRTTWKAEGTLNSAGNVDVLSELQDWYRNGWVVPASAGDNQFYGEKTAALSWVGTWMWPPHSEGLGEDMVMIPAPNFGSAGVKTPNGGWGWAVPATTTNLEDVSRFLNFVMSDEQIAIFSDLVGVMPSRAAAVPLSEKFSQPGQHELFTAQASCCAVVRPVHPAYPTITLAFARAMQNILSDGLADVQGELDAAARLIDQDIEDNQGYPPFGGQ